MKDIVIHVQDSVCAKNHRDPEASALIEAAKSFGTVETLDQALAQERAKAQAEIANLTAQHEKEKTDLLNQLAAIEECRVTPAELEVLRVLRKKSDSEAAEFKIEIQRRDDQLAAVIAEGEARRQQIKSMYDL